MHSIEEIGHEITVLISEVTLGRVASDQVTANCTLIADIGLDSLDYATVMLRCEKWLGAKVEEAAVDWRQILTVADLASLLYRSQR